MEIVWTIRAITRLKEISDFISEDSPLRATNFIDRMIESVERLKIFPTSGAELKPYPEFRYVVFEGYQIIYNHKENIEIVTVISPGLLLKKEELKPVGETSNSEWSGDDDDDL